MPPSETISFICCFRLSLPTSPDMPVQGRLTAGYKRGKHATAAEAARTQAQQVAQGKVELGVIGVFFFGRGVNLFRGPGPPARPPG